MVERGGCFHDRVALLVWVQHSSNWRIGAAGTKHTHKATNKDGQGYFGSSVLSYCVIKESHAKKKKKRNTQSHTQTHPSSGRSLTGVWSAAGVRCPVSGQSHCSCEGSESPSPTDSPSHVPAWSEHLRSTHTHTHTQTVIQNILHSIKSN